MLTVRYDTADYWVLDASRVGTGAVLSRVGFSCSRSGRWRSALVLPLLFLALAFVF